MFKNVLQTAVIKAVEQVYGKPASKIIQIPPEQLKALFEDMSDVLKKHKQTADAVLEAWK